MAQEVTNFGRFYRALGRLPYEGGELEEFNRQIVANYTWNRTESLREMTKAEYNACCDALERMNGERDEQRRLRSGVLKLMQKIGIDTTDWHRVNKFCEDPRIAGKPFARICNNELERLMVKLRAIKRKKVGVTPDVARKIKTVSPPRVTIVQPVGNYEA